MYNTINISSCLEAASRLVTGKCFWRPSRYPVSAKEANVLYPRSVSQYLVSISALDLTYGKRFRKRKTLRVSPIPSGYSV